MIARLRQAARGSGLWRFLSAGVADAEWRAGRLTAHDAPDDADVARVVESSAAVNAVARLIDHVGRAARTSIIIRELELRSIEWRDRPLPDRTRDTGITLLVAAAVHVGLSLWHEPAAGWLWLVPPAVAAVFGTLMTIAPARGSDDRHWLRRAKRACDPSTSSGSSRATSRDEERSGAFRGEGAPGLNNVRGAERGDG